MSRVLKRPMFKMGGSTSSGITSGLKRAKYVEGERVTTEDILKEYGPPPRSSNVYDFLIDFGLNIASIPPQGNIISTAAAAARDPFSRFQEGKSKGEQLAYAMRAQAADAARRQNLAYDEMKMKEKIAEMNISSHKKFGVMSPRPEYELKQTDVLKDNKNIWDKMFSKNRGKWEGSVYYDNSQHKKGNIINAADDGKIVEKDQEYFVDLTKFKEGDEAKIFWDDTSGQWFTVTFNEKDNKWELDKQMPMVISDETENYTDFSLKELQNYLENKKEAGEIQSMDEGTADENILTSMVTENKLEEGMVHPTVDGTATGEISEEYIDEYASKNKIVFDLQEYRNKGGKSAGYRYMTRTFLKNRLKNENAPSIFKDTDAKQDKRKKDRAFKYFSRKRGDKTFYELIQEGKLTMAPQHAPYLDEYKESLQTVVAQAN
jgi:hypothetical protein